MLRIVSRPHPLERITVEGLPRARVGQRLDARGAWLLGGKSRRIVIPRTEKRHSEVPGLWRGVVGVLVFAKARKRLGTLSHAVGLVRTIGEPAFQNKLVNHVLCLLGLIGGLAHPIRRLLKFRRIDIVGIQLEVALRLLRKGDGTSGIRDLMLCRIGGHALRGIHSDEQRQGPLKTLESLPSGPCELTSRVKNLPPLFADLQTRRGQSGYGR